MAETMSKANIQEKVQAAVQQLEVAMQNLQTSEQWKAALNAMATLGPTSIGRFSFRNLLLLLAQRPSVSHAATFATWKRLGRVVKKGEKGLLVLRPRIVRAKSRKTGALEPTFIGFSYLTVFDVAQTEGEPLRRLECQDFAAPEAFPHTVETLRAKLRSLSCISDIAVRARQTEDPPGAYGWFHRPSRSIVVLAEASPAQQFATLVHEAAHAILHGDGEHHDRATKEVEAESTSYVVCAALGLDTSAFTLPYVATWAGGEEPLKAVGEAGEAIRKAASLILGALVPASAEPSDEEAPANEASPEPTGRAAA